MFILFFSDRWNHDDVSVLLKVVEEFIFHSDYSPECSSGRLHDHAEESEETQTLDEISAARKLDGEDADDPPESEDRIEDHA